MKSKATLEAEQYLYKLLLIDKIGIYGSHEVTIGRKPLKKGREIVDFLTIDTNNIVESLNRSLNRENIKVRKGLIQ